MERFNCTAIVGNEQLVFKRYGKDEETVRKELESFINEAYQITCHVQSVEKDKTHSIET